MKYNIVRGAKKAIRWTWLHLALPYRITLGKYLKEKKESRPIYHTYRIDEIFANQNRPEGYNRWDIVVRLLAIECEKGLNDYGWDLYKKMCAARSGESWEEVGNRVERFRTLINGEVDYRNIPIELDGNMLLYDGSHRIALAIWGDYKDIKCMIDPTLDVYDTVYGEEWFANNDFNDEELRIIRDRVRKLLDTYAIRIPLLLWPPAIRYYDEITKAVEDKLGGCNVVEYRDISYDDTTFEDMIWSVYSVDDVASWKIEKKLEHMRDCRDKTVRYILLEFDNPVFRAKTMNGNTILTQGEELKDHIRTEYETRVDNYFFDIICHSADNMYQAKVVSDIFNSYY